MAQLRRDYKQFADRDTVIIVVGPDNAESFLNYWHKNNLQFTGLPDKNHSILKLYGQEVKLFKFGRQPAQVLIDKKGMVRYVHYGLSMSDIPGNEELIALIDGLHAETKKNLNN